MSVPLLNSAALKPVVDLLVQKTSSREVDWAFRQVDLDRRLVEKPPAFLPLDLEARLAEALARRIGDRHLGARIGQCYDYTQLTWYSDFVLAGKNLGEAFLRAAKALPSIHTGSFVSLDQRGHHSTLLFHSKIQHVLGARHIDESLPFIMMDLARRFIGQDWKPAWIEVPAGQHKETSALEDIYGVAVKHRPTGAGITFASSLLSTPNPNKVRAEKAVLLHDIPRLFGVKPPSSMAETVTQILRLQIELGDASIETVAERLSLGVQTLQRSLRKDGTSFRELRAAFLQERAIGLLRDTDHSVSEIAEALGYDETNSFRRAFRSWTGISPSGYCRNDHI